MVCQRCYRVREVVALKNNPIDLTEVEPGKWMTRDQANAHHIVKNAMANSDFTGSKWRLEEDIGRLSRPLRVGIFLLFTAAMIAFFLGPLKAIGAWLFYS